MPREAGIAHIASQKLPPSHYPDPREQIHLLAIDPSSPWTNPAHHLTLAIATGQAHTATSSAPVHPVFLALKEGILVTSPLHCFLPVRPLEIPGPVLTLLVSFLMISVNQAGNQLLAEH